MAEKIYPGEIYHIYNRSVLKILLFREKLDYMRFMQKIVIYKKKYPVEILSFCLMPTHFHLLMREPIHPTTHGGGVSALSRFMQRLQNSQARYFGIKYKHSGRVFQGVFKRKRIKDDEQLANTMTYIEDNPVRKKIVKTAIRWPYSSASNPSL